MTLILTAICSDGVLIRADRRCIEKHTNGTCEIHDDLNKVLVSDDRSVVIYNHGINTFCGTRWEALAQRVMVRITREHITSAYQVARIVRACLHNEVMAELARNQIDTLSSFVVIARCPERQFIAGEACWERGSNPREIELGRFIRSGEGTLYLEIPEKLNTDAYWAELTIAEARKQTNELWQIAVDNQSRTGGEDFSPLWDELAIQL